MIRLLWALSGLVSGSSVFVVQAISDGQGLGLDTIVQTGVTGTLAAALMVFARTAYTRETQRADRLEQKLDELNKTVLDRYAGALADAARAVADATTTLSKVR